MRDFEIGSRIGWDSSKVSPGILLINGLEIAESEALNAGKAF